MSERSAASPARLIPRLTRQGSGSMIDDTLFTVEEVASRLGVHPETVRKWIKNGQLRATNLGGRAGYRISKSALDQFLREREEQPKDDD
jgi:excisionase family DNA binding protein